MIEDFEIALARERARELGPTIAAMSEIQPPKHLRLLRGTVKAFYDDGFELAMDVELHPNEIPEPTKRIWKSGYFLGIVISLALYSCVYLALEFSDGPINKGLAQWLAVVLIAAASFLCGRNWK